MRRWSAIKLFTASFATIRDSIFTSGLIIYKNAYIKELGLLTELKYVIKDSVCQFVQINLGKTDDTNQAYRLLLMNLNSCQKQEEEKTYFCVNEDITKKAGFVSFKKKTLYIETLAN